MHQDKNWGLLIRSRGSELKEGPLKGSNSIPSRLQDAEGVIAGSGDADAPEQAEESVSLRPPLVYCHKKNKVVTEERPSSGQAVPSGDGSALGSTALPPSAPQGPAITKGQSSGSDEDIDICSDDEMVEAKGMHFGRNKEIAGTTHSNNGGGISERRGATQSADRSAPAQQVPGDPGPAGTGGTEEAHSMDAAAAVQAASAGGEGGAPAVSVGAAAGSEDRTVPAGKAPPPESEAVSAGPASEVPPVVGSLAVRDGQDGGPWGACSASSPSDSAGVQGTEPEVEIVAAGPEPSGSTWPHVALGAVHKGSLSHKANSKTGKASPGPKPPKKPSSSYILFSVDFRWVTHIINP